MTTSLQFPARTESPTRAPARVPVLQLRGEGPRRALNVVVAALGLLITAPLMAVIAVLVKLTSPGPVLFRQVRVGLNRRGLSDWFDDAGGTPFTMYKFRTMRQAPSAARQVWAQPNDARVTAIGRLLRRYRLDELPQLWNVLVGDMNIVGPRPEQPNIFTTLRRTIPRYSLRQRVRPGITGLAQVQLPPDQNVNDVRRKLALDLEYIRQASFWSDFRIMVRTPAAMFGRRLGW